MQPLRLTLRTSHARQRYRVRRHIRRQRRIRCTSRILQPRHGLKWSRNPRRIRPLLPAPNMSRIQCRRRGRRQKLIGCRSRGRRPIRFLRHATRSLVQSLQLGRKRNHTPRRLFIRKPNHTPHRDRRHMRLQPCTSLMQPQRCIRSRLRIPRPKRGRRHTLLPQPTSPILL